MIEREAPAGRTRADAAWGLYLAALSTAGAVSLARVPPAMLRAHAAMGLMLMLSFALGGVVADATWNDRPWRRMATQAAATAVGLFTVAKYAEVLWNFVAPSPSLFAPAPRVLRVVLLASLFVLSIRRETASARRVPRPTPSS